MSGIRDNNITKDPKHRLLIVGGHLTPALAVLSEFLSRGVLKENITWVGHKFTMIGDEKSSAEYNEVTARGIKFINLKTGKLYRTLSWNAVVSFFRIPFGFIQSLVIILSERPKVVMSFGGYLAVPIAFWAKIFGVPVFTHEQTLIVGRANLFIQKLATKVFLSWQQVFDSLSEEQKKSGKYVVTGNPIRKEVFEKRTDKFDFNNGKKTIYITGGNQGSHKINEVVIKILPELLQKYNVIHQCGSTTLYNDIETLNQFRESLPLELQDSYIVQTGFWEDEIGAVFANADILVSRSGANSITEILALQKPSVLIPIPWTAGNEQVLNADMVYDLGLALIIEQDQNFNGKNLLDIIERVSKINTESLNLGEVIIKDAEKRIVDEVLEKVQS